LGISVWEERVPFATSSIRSIRGSRGTPGRLKDRERHGTGDKNNKDEKSVNGTQIFHWEVSTVKTGLAFQKIRLFRNISVYSGKFPVERTKKSFPIYNRVHILGFLVT